MLGDLGRLLRFQGAQPHGLAEVVNDGEDVAVNRVAPRVEIAEVNLQGAR
jgi:hypothetical protein